GLDELPHPVAETGDHRAPRACVQDPAAPGGRQPHALAALDDRIVEIERPREHGGRVRPDRRSRLASHDGYEALCPVSDRRSMPATSLKKWSNSLIAAS